MKERKGSEGDTRGGKRPKRPMCPPDGQQLLGFADGPEFPARRPAKLPPTPDWLLRLKAIKVNARKREEARP